VDRERCKDCEDLRIAEWERRDWAALLGARSSRLGRGVASAAGGVPACFSGAFWAAATGHTPLLGEQGKRSATVSSAEAPFPTHSFWLKVPPCVTKNPQCRKQLRRWQGKHLFQYTALSYWLFPVHRGFRHAGRDFSSAPVDVSHKSWHMTHPDPICLSHPVKK
jgi:hypothetical protein